MASLWLERGEKASGISGWSRVDCIIIAPARP
jgi:hypothetical protein